MAVMLATSLGDIVIDLHTDRCPLTSKNFLKLCKIKYYNHCLFHSVQKDFIAQTGDPSGKGTGGDSIYKFLYGEQARFFSDEIHPDLKHSKLGTVAMASGGENLNASQFYITLREEMDYLDGKHTVFGEVAEGLDTLMRINEAFVDDKGRPYKNIRIKHTYILDDPFEDPPQLAELIPENSPEQKPPEEGEEVRLEDDWVPMDEQQDPEELEKSMRKKEAHSRAVVLEMIGDIPEAEVKPPENVLFVCKLNPVTQEEDLEVIFSRFGKVVSADIIRDHKTGDSLCYAFIEFETQEACEAAYFKMDNVLIDDRRIHVDFSQSVSKLWNQYRRAGRKSPGDKGKGHGCFKCGELGHVAKDCPEDANNASKGAAPEKPKYVLKDINRQHGDGKKSYDMIFDEDMPATGNRKSQHEDYRHEKSNELKRDVRGTDRGDKERRELDHLRREGGNRSHEKERDRESKEKRDIERYREGRERERSGVEGNRNRDRYGERDKYREERESNRHWEDRKRDRSTDDGIKDNDKYKQERGSDRHWEDRERERFNDDGSRTRDRYGEQDKYREEKKNNKHQEDRKIDRSTDDGSKDRLRYGEHRDRDKYREDKESNRQWERGRGQRDTEYQEIEGDREKDTYITQREAETDRDKSDKEMLKSDRGTKRHIEEQKKATDRKDSRNERHREDRTSKGDTEKDTYITQRKAEINRDKSDKEMLKSDRGTKRHREEQKRATDRKDSRSERQREDGTSKRHGEERRGGRSPEDRSYRRRS